MVHTYIHTGKHPQIQNKNKQNLERERREGKGRGSPERSQAGETQKANNRRALALAMWVP